MSAAARRGDDDGAILVLVLIFLLVIAPILTSLVSLSGTNLLNTNNLERQRNLEFAADTYMDGAIQADRYVAVTSTATGACQSSGHNESAATFPAGSGFLPNNEALAVWCLLGTLENFPGRNVEFDVCSTAITSWASCDANSVLRAQIIYNDSSSYGFGTNIVSWTLITASH